MNARTKLIGRIVLLVMGAMGVLYLIIGYFFSEGFSCRTKINGVKCTGKSVAEVNTELCKQIDYKGISVKDLNGADLFINAEELGFSVDYTDALNEYINNQDALSWGKYAFKGQAGTVEPVITYDKDKLDQKIAEWDIFVPDDSQDVSIAKTEEGYSLQNTMLSTPIKDNIVQAVGDAAVRMEGEIDLSAEQYADCYEPVTLTEEQQQVVDFCNKLQSIYNCGLTYKFGSRTIPLKGEVADSFILTYDQISGDHYDYENPGNGHYIAGSSEISNMDEVRNIDGYAASPSGDPLISEARLYDFFYQLAKDTDTADLIKRYQNGEDVEIMIRKDRTGITKIFDHNEAYKALKASFMDGTFVQEEERNLTDPKKVDFFNAKNELKGTYIELDISNQHLYYYVNGKVSIDTAIVSGTMVGGHGTPAGLFHVYDKQRNKVLVGEDYECPVEYWMRLTDTGVGIHDAWWQESFGGETYRDAGSHGCINCPPDIARQLYEAVKEKTPVVVYYRKGVSITPDPVPEPEPEPTFDPFSYWYSF